MYVYITTPRPIIDTPHPTLHPLNMQPLYTCGIVHAQRCLLIIFLIGCGMFLWEIGWLSLI